MTMTDPRADETPSDKIKGESELKYPLPWIIVSPKFLALNSSEYLLRKAREKKNKIEKAINQKDGVLSITNAPAIILIVYKAAKTIQSITGIIFKKSE